VSVVLAIHALTTVSHSQTAASKPKTAVPVTMTECEGTNNCATWRFLGAQGNGQWPSGEVANLSVERYDVNSVVIRRADSTGSSAGLTAVYTGIRHHDRVGGEYTSSWPGHWNGKSGNWYATVERNPAEPPSAMHICLANCGTWTLDKGPPFNKPRCGSAASATLVTVDCWTPESVIRKRTDTGSIPGTAILTGKLSGDGNSIVNGSIAWTWHPCCGTGSGPFTAARGTGHQYSARKQRGAGQGKTAAAGSDPTACRCLYSAVFLRSGFSP
jgi:hypothetical protein